VSFSVDITTVIGINCSNTYAYSNQ